MISCKYCGDAVDTDNPFEGFSLGNGEAVCNSCDSKYMDLRDEAIDLGIDAVSAHSCALAAITE